MVSKRVMKIIEREDPELHKNLLIDLVQLDKKNEQRLLELYTKY